MLKFKSLSFQFISIFIEPQTINFDQLGRLVEMAGINKNTGGSSGAAKTSAFLATEFLFGINSTPDNQLQSRLTKEKMWANGIFDYDGKELFLERGKKGLKIVIDGEVYEGSSKLQEERLDAILGVSRDLFRKMLHKRQNEGGFFLAFGPKDTYDFLVDGLNLQETRKKSEIAKNAADEYEKKTKTANVDLEKAKAALEATTKAMDTLGERPAIEDAEERITNLKAAVAHAQELLEQEKKSNQLDMDTLEARRPKADVGQFDETKLSAHLGSRKMVEEKINAARLADNEAKNQIASQAHERKAEHTRVENEKKARIQTLGRVKEAGETAKANAIATADAIKFLRANECFMCHQPWHSEESKKKELDLLADITKHREAIQAGADAAIAAELLRSEITADKFNFEHELTALQSSFKPNPKLEEYQGMLNAVDEHIGEEQRRKTLYFGQINENNRQRTVAFQAEVMEMRKRHDYTIASLADDLGKRKQSLDSTVGALRAANDAVIRYDATAKQLMEQHQAASVKLSEATQALRVVSRRYLMAEEARRALKGYTSRLFDNALQVISENATRYIRQIPNMQNATIQLSSTKETATGKVNEQVNAVIHNNGEENIPIRTLSGGERTSADLAVDLAAIQWLEDEAGKGIDLFLMDEPFRGLEEVNIEAIIEMLRVSSLTKRIVVVDHNPIIREQFESKIRAVRTGSSSVICA